MNETEVARWTDWLPLIYVAGSVATALLLTFVCFLTHMTEPAWADDLFDGILVDDDGLAIGLAIFMVWLMAWFWPMLIPIGVCWWAARRVAADLNDKVKS